MYRYIITFILLFVSQLIINAKQYPSWLEVDSINAIQKRINGDFTIEINDAIIKLKESYSNVNFDSVRCYIDSNYLESKIINGKEYLHKKSIGNFRLLYPKLNNWKGRGALPDKEDIDMVNLIVKTAVGDGTINCGNKIRYRFTIDVDRHDFLFDDTLKVWLPLPIESARQKNIRIISTSHPNYILSSENSEHNTIYMSECINNTSDSVIHFEYVGEYETYSQYFSPQYILNNIKPYNKKTLLYKKYTDITHKHIIRLDSLAKRIVGEEKCPYLQSEMVYNYISQTFPWAGAREYSTIECLPQYVLDEEHGDCGQVALLYISLMRTLGVPARWESGWMLHPWSKNLHDWAEVYFEGIGWVPVDVSFGRYINESNTNVRDFFSTGMDNFRFATNTGICSSLYPPKRFLRSETIDFQMGEVECSKGNLFYPGWKKKLEVISITKIN